MIVPQSRLLWWTGLVILPVATVGVLLPEALWLAGALMCVIIAAAALDAARALGVLDGIRVELPEVVRLSKDRAGEIELKLHNDRPENARHLRLGLPFPREISTPEEDVRAVLPAKAECSLLRWPCTPLKRGNYHLNRCYLEGESAWGFWAVRSSVPVQSELRVYPNLLGDRKSVAALFLNRGAFGIHAQRQIGKGRDFEKLREYVPGDSFDDIHWKATAKRGRPVTKIYQIERTQEVYVIIDSSRLSAREAHAPANHGPGNTTTTLERYLNAALMLGLAAEQQGDHFGLLVFSDRVEGFVRAKNGQAHYSACRDAIYTMEPRLVTPDFDEVGSFIRVRLRKRALLVFLTALDDPVLSENFVRNMDLICRQHLILVNMMQPPGAEPLFSRPDVQQVDDLYQRLGGHMRWHNLRELDKTLRHRGVGFSLLDNEKLTTQLVTQYLSVKRRQLL